MSWYRTHRPQTFASLHLPEVREAFDRIRVSGTFSHAYLFTGPKGTGKTSSARILAKMLNCEKNSELVKKSLSKLPQKDPKPFVEPCGVCPACISITNGSSLCVVEMDAASNRGIDDIRLLRERINLAPNDGLVSVYIIDEVHMLTTEAFNALLKVLEEPPRHVVFVLATTELHKVPDTIVSRCTTVQYRKASDQDLESALTSVVQGEHIAVEQGVLLEIAKRADGSFRDAIKMLEQLATGLTTLTTKDLERLGDGNTSQTAIELVEALLAKQVNVVSEIFSGADQKQTDLAYLHKKTLEACRARLGNAIQSRNSAEAMHLQKLMSVLNVSLDPLLPIPTLPFELAALSWCLEDGVMLGEVQVARVQPTQQSQIPPAQQRPQPTIPAKIAYEKKETPLPVQKVVVEQKKVSPMTVASTSAAKDKGTPMTGEQLVEGWGSVLQFIKGTNTTVEALLRAARPISYDGTICVIEIFYPFHKEQLEQDKYRRAVEKALSEGYKLPLPRVNFVLGDKATRPQRTPKSDDLVKATTDALM